MTRPTGNDESHQSNNDNGSHDDHHMRSSDERTPLLATGTIAPTTDPEIATQVTNNTTKPHKDDDDDDDDDKPLPKTQVILLCYARMIEPIAFFSIFPFVNQMVQRNGSLPDAQVGFYSGLIESLFSLTQMVVMIFWGRASDRFGRKPVLVISLFGVTCATSLFGFAGTVWQMVLFRCLAGVFAGNVVTIRTMLGELSTRKTQATAFSWFMFANNLGIFLGPLVGGALADPATQYGGWFARGWFFRRFPYALPTLTTASFGLVSSVVVAIFVEETLHSKKRNNKKNVNGGVRDEDDGGGAASQVKKGKLTTWQLLKEPGVSMVLYLYLHIMVLAFANTAVTPVFWFEPIHLGGFGFKPFQISFFLAVTGAAQAIWTLFVFPPLQHKFGTGWVLRACGFGWLFLFPCYPVLNLLLRHSVAHRVAWERTFFWVVSPILLAFGVGVSMSFTAIQLALNDVSPSYETLGTLNAVALASVAGVRSFTPALFTSIYAFGVERQILGGQLVWVVMIALAAAYILLVGWLPAKAQGRIDRDG